ncbi:hypothetical protein QKT26_gp96 [Carcinus maenas nudivirus]|uniref:Uncharacterized protein n=1 Tax=Carcinus maenas nudivirus TaxID=2880837 RepID=A0AAE8Y0D3_9VIRU|nr:hypothetical protein QKT26_gp96 [Carcinus maenas nudivirus]UBZ25686.1 hypothetical protein CmNV_095 [Carcinus maenas nudivirus]
MQLLYFMCLIVAWLPIIAAKRPHELSQNSVTLEKCIILEDTDRLFSITNNITIKPKDHYWSVLFGLSFIHKDDIKICIFISQGKESVYIAAYAGKCSTHNGIYSDQVKMNIPVNAWNTLSTHINRVNFEITHEHSDLIMSLPTTYPVDAMSVLETTNVELAIGCVDNCPSKVVTSVDTTPKSINFQREEVLFYYRPGYLLQILEYEVMCASKSVYVTNIKTYESLEKWYLLELFHTNGIVMLKIDKILDAKMQLPSNCKFVSHVLKVKGSCIFNFCEPENSPDENVAATNYVETKTHNFPNAILLATIFNVIFLLFNIVAVVTYCVLYKSHNNRI